MKEKDEIKLGSVAEDLFIEIFMDTFGAENAGHMMLQYPFVDIYGNSRFIDFALESEGNKIAIEIDGETYHNPSRVSQEKYYDDLLKQNSMIHDNWKVYRWVYKQLKEQPERVKDELATFLGELPLFSDFTNFLPKQKGKVIILKEHQQEAIDSLRKMREKGETIALLCHATGTGKTITAVLDAKDIGKRTLFIAHTKELVNKAHERKKQVKDAQDILWQTRRQKPQIVVLSKDFVDAV